MSLRLLLADDHPLILWAYRYELERAGGFEIVAEVHTGSQVLPRTGQTSPDVVLLDIGLPELDGHSIFEALRRERPGIYRVVFTTVRSSEVDQMRALEAGALDYLIKPISLRVLLEKIRRWLRR